MDQIHRLDPNLSLWYVVQDLCVVQIQPRKHTVDGAGYTAPTRQHELDHTDHTDHTDQEYICPAWQIEIITWESITHPKCGTMTELTSRATSRARAAFVCTFSP